MKTQAVFFDRDGTLGDDARLEFPTQHVPFGFVFDVFAAIRAKGVRVFIFTNQACIARGKDGGYDFAAEFRAYGADDWFICPHDGGDRCACRKPANGLLLQAREKYGLDLTRCVTVGDRTSDGLAGLSVGARAVLVLTGRGAEEVKSAAFGQYKNQITVIRDIRNVPPLLS
ncbi:D,D-heptose 1,7-bisphosphate phosphatase [Clostridia bacterium]|nr:D,D-heptose 1,7-bisphosphate phosphatase [Clostridia bacterium]